MRRTRSLALSGILAIAVAAGLAAGCVERRGSAVTSSGDLRITSLDASPDTIFINQQSLIRAEILDTSGEGLTYNWQAYRGAVAGDGPEVRYFGSYCCAGTDWVVLTVTNADGETDSRSVVLHVIVTESPEG